jgi:5'-nucleotidase
MTPAASPLVDWTAIDTVLVDMDGTLLDLNFDTFFWSEAVPERYARLHGLTMLAARQSLAPRFEAKVGTLEWFCLGLALVTNAHRDTFAVKAEHTGIDRLVDSVVCSHDFAAPKESAAFWRAFDTHEPFDVRRTLLIEDSLAVLAAARAYGLEHTIAIRRPDSQLPPRATPGFVGVDGVFELV